MEKYEQFAKEDILKTLRELGYEATYRDGCIKTNADYTVIRKNFVQECFNDHKLYIVYTSEDGQQEAGFRIKTAPINKLVRDKIPDIIMADDKTCIVKKARDYEYRDLLRKKIDEELKEFFEEIDKNDSNYNIMEELVDVMTATIHYIKANACLGEGFDAESYLCCNLDNVIEMYKNKEDRRGGFDKGYVLLDVNQDLRDI